MSEQPLKKITKKPGRPKKPPVPSYSDFIGKIPKARGFRTRRTPDAETAVIECLKLGLNLQSSCGVACVLPDTFENWMRKDPALRARVHQARESVKGMVVGYLMDIMVNGRTENARLNAIQFWLRTRTEEFREHKEDNSGDEAVEADLRFL